MSLDRITSSNLSDNSVDNRVIDNYDIYTFAQIYSTYTYATSASFDIITADRANIESVPSHDLYNGVVFSGTRDEFYCSPTNGDQDILMNGGQLIAKKYLDTYNQIVINIDATASYRNDVIVVDNLDRIVSVVKGVDGSDEIPEIGANHYPIAVVHKTSTGIIQDDIYHVFNYFKNGHDEGVLTMTIASSGFIPLPTSTTKTMLSKDITDSVTEIDVVCTDDMPINGLVKIGSEYVKYEGKTKTKLLNCTRGYDSSIADSHSSFDFTYKAFDQDQCEWFVSPRIAGDTSLSWGPNPYPPNDIIGYWMFNFKCFVGEDRLAQIMYDSAFHVNRNVDSLINVYIRGHEVM